jgi:hypothetical protein
VKFIMTLLFGGFFVGTNLYALVMSISRIH